MVHRTSRQIYSIARINETTLWHRLEDTYGTRLRTHVAVSALVQYFASRIWREHTRLVTNASPEPTYYEIHARGEGRSRIVRSRDPTQGATSGMCCHEGGTARGVDAHARSAKSVEVRYSSRRHAQMLSGGNKGVPPSLAALVKDALVVHERNTDEDGRVSSVRARGGFNRR